MSLSPTYPLPYQINFLHVHFFIIFVPWPFGVSTAELDSGWLLFLHLLLPHKQGGHPTLPAHPTSPQELYPEEENHFGDKMYWLKDIRVEYLNGAKHEYQSEKQMFDNMYIEDIYYNLPRAVY